MKTDEQVANALRLMEGRALLEEEIKWALRLQKGMKQGFQEEEINQLLAKVITEGEVVCKPALEAIAYKEGEGEAFSFFSSWIRKAFRKRHRNGSGEGKIYRCNRCGADNKYIHVVYCHRCQGECAYCRRCLTMGRSSCCAKYYLFPNKEEKASEIKISPIDALRSYPQLTEAQRTAACEMLRFYELDDAHTREFLVWAVCGAGKTELMFPLLHYLLENGRCVLWATPRRDVVLELAPRLRRAFPEHQLAVLHGSTPSYEKWTAARFVLATTHQALRFYRYFDAVIIDEVDAFPYTNDEMLPFAVQRARKLPGKTVYLTATPRPDYQKRMYKSREHKSFLPHVKIPVRYHGSPLPEPGICRESQLNERLRTKKPISTLLAFTERLMKKGSPAFIFVPAIRQLPVLYDYLVAHNTDWRHKIETVYASDPEREAKVMALREGRLQVLLTTTIMERGVTLSGIQILVCQADAPVFDEAALVQIAGRAGRSASEPNGTVIFMAEEVTDAMKAAVRQIREMNRLAVEQGHIKTPMADQP